MRLHRLELTAFGPFAGTETVDFDRLAESGLFLLHGATGAGKSSLLDAVCFALYGRVPGVRGSRARLRSDHAAEGEAPQVVCEFSVGERRLELTRSPDWLRPKRRGDGVVREPAKALLREWTGEEWTPLSSRADEIGDVVLDLVGFGAEQFTKLVLLPQGEFAAFLRSGAEERRTMLQRLFGTERFDEVERWLAERRRELSQAVGAAGRETAVLAARAEEAWAGIRPPDQGPALAGDLSPEDTAAAVHDLAERAAAVRDEAAALTGRLAAELAEARAELTAAREVAERAARRAELEQELAALETAAPEQARRRARLASARAADVLEPLVAALDRTTRHRDAAAGALLTAVAAAVEAGVEVPLDAPGPAADAAPADERLAALAGELRQELGVLAEVLRDERRLAEAEAELERLTKAGARARARLAAADDELARLAEQRAALAEEQHAAAAAGAALADRERDAERAQRVAESVLDRERRTAEHAGLADAERAAVDVHQAAQQHALDLRERRLSGMAAELAANLAEGEPCPVCGADGHPAPARPAEGGVTQAAERTAAKAVREAEERRRAAERAARESAAALAVATERAAGADPASAAAALREALDAAAAAREAAGRAAALAERGTALRGTEAAARERRTAHEQAAAAAADALAAAGERAEALRERVERARGEDTGVAARHARVAARAAAAEALLAARRADAESAAALSDAVATLGTAAARAGFGGPAEALAAVLPAAEQARLTAAADEHDAALARARALHADLAGPEVAPDEDEELDLLGLLAALEAPAEERPVDLADLAGREERAAAAAERAAAAHALAARAAEALTGHARDLHRHAVATAPLRHRHAILDDVSRCAEGTGGDNELRMRLSAYVLAARLEQVAEVASERLHTMSGGRYRLVHSDDPARGQGRSGLGLAVVDGWTGVRRDPSSLSGGETFYASLALALGLADVVRAEAGGAVIETLLVDEGFGTLDAETLDEVMDTLDGLRSGGRAVGLVSHVADLRDRIPVRLEVLKGRTGSTLRVPAA